MKLLIKGEWEYAYVLGDNIWYFAKVKELNNGHYDSIINGFYWRDLPANKIRFPQSEKEINQFKLHFHEKGSENIGFYDVI